MPFTSRSESPYARSSKWAFSNQYGLRATQQIPGQTVTSGDLATGFGGYTWGTFVQSETLKLCVREQLKTLHNVSRPRNVRTFSAAGHRKPTVQRGVEKGR